MLTSVQEPVIEACKLRLNCESQQVRTFLTKFMDSPDAETFTSNVDGAPGFCVYDSRNPVEGLQTLGFEGAEQLKTLYRNIRCPRYQDEEVHKANTCFEDGDLLIIQARQNFPHSGGSTMLGKLRFALHKAAVAEGLIQPDTDHHYLWVTEFPMFTLDNDTDPGQGGTAGFSATHHPFTAPRTAEDVDLLLTDPLKAKADHYDLVVNGVELGGGSRRIHNAEMQKFVMRDIIKVCKLNRVSTNYLLNFLDERRPHERFLSSLRGSRLGLPASCRLRHRIRSSHGYPDWCRVGERCDLLPQELEGRGYDGQKSGSNNECGIESISFGT
jgi:aspartyl-tRNA synthetase